MNLDRIKSALTRKVGPLPAWIWLAILAAGAYYWQRRKGGVTSTGTDTSASIDSNQTPSDPVTLSPGDQVYDPATGQLLGSGQAPTDPQAPVTLEPGEAVFDPSTGQLVTNPDPSTTSNSGKSGKPKPTGTKKKNRPSTRHLLDELRHPGQHSAAHLARVRRMLAARHVKIPRTPHTGSSKNPHHPHDKHTKKHKPQHTAHPQHTSTRPHGQTAIVKGAPHPVRVPTPPKHTGPVRKRRTR